MLNIRKSKPEDYNHIYILLNELDLGYESQKYENFYVGEVDSTIVAILELDLYPEYSFLSNVGVTKSMQSNSFASQLINEILNNTNNNIYLYTVIPGFFEKLGFIKCNFNGGLPSRDLYDCHECCIEKCACMVRKPK